MARSRQRRKQRQQDRPINAEEAAADATLGDEVDHPVPAVEPPAEEYPTEIEGEFDLPDTETLIAAIGPLRRARSHPLLSGIRMFTAMLEEARGGYAVDRLEQMEQALGLDFNQLEREGILQISMAEMDDSGVPDVETGVQLALEARAELGVDSLVEGDSPDFASDPDQNDPRAGRDADQGYVSQTEEGERLEATGASEVDVKAMDEQVLERRAEEAVAAVGVEEEDHDAPGSDEED